MPPAVSTDKKAPVSIRRLASLTGASRSTISRAFRDDASVRPELRARILAEAERLGYRPDPWVSELMTSFARRQPVDYRETLGVIWWPDRWNQSEAPEPNFAVRLKAGLVRAAEKHGCRLNHFVLQPGRDAALMRTLRARRIQGLVLTPPSVPGLVAPTLDWAGLSAVAIGRSLSAPSFNCVHHNHYSAMAQVVRRLKERGFRRPLLLVLTGLEERMQRAYTGAFLAHEGGTAEQVLHLEWQDGARLERRLRTLRPDVVIGDVEGWAEVWRGLPARARRRGLAVLDVSRADGPVSGVHQNVERMAECAVDLLMQGRLHNETGLPADPIDVQTPGVWVEGETLGAPGA